MAHDVVASIRRFATRIPFAAALMAATDELSATDDRTVRFRLKRPFPHLPEALAGPGGVVPAIMPERLAATSPFKPVAEITGSGPYRFLPDEHVIGARAAYERSTLYQPRQDGPVGFTSGPKIAHFDRIEWLELDQFSAMAALRNGEIDWWEVPPNDQIQTLSRDRDITVISQYATATGILRFNHLHPPFDNEAVRRALLGAVDQAEAMTAVAGTDRAFWHDGVGLFPAGTPFANDAGVEVLHKPRDYNAVSQALAHAGYNGEQVVVLVPTNVQEIRALSLAGVDQLRRAGMNVDLQEMEQGARVQRLLNQANPDKGGWSAFFGLLDRSVPKHQPLWQPHDPRRWARCGAWLADEPAHRRVACRLARRQQPGRAAAHLHRIADAIVAGRAVHPDGRILAVHRLSQGSARRAAGLLRGILGYSPSLRCYYQKSNLRAPSVRADRPGVDQICEPPAKAESAAYI